MASVVCTGKSKNAVVLNRTSGEHLHYRIEVSGAMPQFVFACAHRGSIKSAVDFTGHPMAVYEWDYLQNPAECDAQGDEGDVYGISMSFVAASKYRLRIEHRQADGAVMEVLSDLVCESNKPEDTARRGLEVFCA